MKLSGKVAIVTGSSRGIGKAIALQFAREGADVVVAARTEVSKGELPGTIGETAEAIRALGGRVLALRCNVAEEDDVAQMIEKTVAEFGRVDILINNAAIGYYVNLMEIPPKHWDLVMRVNVKGPFLCCRAVVPLMANQGGGSIVNLTSPAAVNVYSGLPKPDGTPNTSGILYGASKAALERFTIGLAAEVAADNIAVNAVKPVVATFSEGLRFWRRDADPDLWLSPDVYMTKAVVFLAMQNARGITGKVVDDQWLCKEYGLQEEGTRD